MAKALKITACSILAALLAGVVFLCGCSNYQHDMAFWFMGSTAIISAYLSPTEEQSSDELFDDLCYDINEILTDVDESLTTSAPSKGEEGSSVYRFNETEPGETVEIDEYCYDVLSIALDMYDKTDGYFNPAVYYSVTAYGFGENGKYPSSASELPSDEEVAAYVELSESFPEIVLESEGGKFYAIKPSKTVTVNGEALSMKIDLGGIGKGYATDIVSDLMDSYGCEYGYFNFAGSSLALKRYDDKNRDRCYELDILNPRGNLSTDICASVNVRDCNLSTSGDYEQCYSLPDDGDDDKVYCHIISPKTGSPIETGIMSVTVIDGSAAENDCYTTALMAMEIDEAAAFVKENLSDKRVILVYEQDGECFVEANFEDVKISDGFESNGILK